MQTIALNLHFNPTAYDWLAKQTASFGYTMPSREWVSSFAYDYYIESFIFCVGMMFALGAAGYFDLHGILLLFALPGTMLYESNKILPEDEKFLQYSTSSLWSYFILETMYGYFNRVPLDRIYADMGVKALLYRM